MVSITLITLGLFGAVWVVHFLLQTIIAFSIDVEEVSLSKAVSPKNLEHLKSISALQSLEAILATVFTATLPVTGIIVGAILPDPVRSFLSGAVGEKAVIIITLTALFAYYAVFRRWKKYQGKKFWTAMVQMFGLVGKKARKGTLKQS